MKDIFHVVSLELNPKDARGFFESSRMSLINDFPLLDGMIVDFQGDFIYNGIASPSTFISTVSTWLNDVLVEVRKASNQNVLAGVEEIITPYSVTLKAMDFYRSCPILDQR